MDANSFAPAAARLAGQVAVLLGWTPDQFWRATPCELASVFAALTPATDTPAARADLARLKEQFPDG